MIKPQHYSTHAIEDLRKLTDSLEAYPITHRNLKTVIKLLHKGTKFILPNCSNLIDYETFNQTHMDLVRLPYPITIFEASWTNDDVDDEDLGGYLNIVSPKRIALCVEVGHGSFGGGFTYEEKILNRFPQGGVFVLPIYYQNGMWNCMAACTFVPYEQTLNDRDFPVSNASKMARESLEKSGLAAKKNNFTFNAEPVPLLPEICNQTYAAHGFDNDRTLQQIILDTRDEIWMLISACSVLNCENITIDQIDAPKSLNAKRRKKNKAPFYDYHYLSLFDYRINTGRKGVGSNTKKRMHLRRGHIRRLESGKTTWVTHAIVGKDQSSMLEKDYVVKQREKV